MKIWEVKKLDDLIKDGTIVLTRGKVISKKDLYSFPGDFPVYSSAKENDGIFGRYGHYMFDEELITWSVDGGGRIFHRTKHKYSVTNVGGILRIKDTNKLDYRYLFYALTFLHSQVVFDWVKKAHPSVIRRIYQEIPIIPLPEQQHIVAILDEGFAAVEKAKANVEKNLQNAHELFESYLENIDAEKELLYKLVDITTGKLDANAAIENGQYPFFTCSKEVFAIDKYAFDCEAILLAGNNAVGDFNVKHYQGKFNAYQRTYVITVNNETRVLYRYLYYQLLKSLKELKKQSVGVGTKFLKLGMIKNLKIALPSLPEQFSIVAKLDSLSMETKKLEVIYKQKLADLEELKKSLLQKAFNGELTEAQ